VSQTDPQLGRALVRWRHAAGAYWPYVCSVPFLATLTSELPEPAHPAATLWVSDKPLAEGLELARSEGRAAVLVDLPIEDTLRQAEAIRRLGFRTVPVVQRWITPGAALPGRRLVRNLVRHQPHELCADTELGVVLLLDGERGRAAGRVRAGRFDNRYSYPVCRFPPACFLLADGVRRLVCISDKGLAPDLHNYAEEASRAGIVLAGCAL